MRVEIFKEPIHENNTKFFYLVDQMSKWGAKRLGWLDWFTARERPCYSMPSEIASQSALKLVGTPAEIKPFSKWPVVHIPNANYKGDIIYRTEPSPPTNEFSTYGVICAQDNSAVILLRLGSDATYAPFTMGDQFVLTSGMIANYEGEPTVTDVGKFFFNYLLLVDPFDGRPFIPYINARMVPGDLDDKVAALLTEGKIGRKEYNAYLANGYTFCEDGSLATVTWSPAVLTINPKVLARKKELFEKYKDKLDDPSIMVQIEEELVRMDKATFAGDPAEPFVLADAKKIFGEQRRKFFIQFGVASDFSKFGGTVYMANSLSHGMDIKDIPIGANEVRRGSYDRGKETAKGGEQTKFLLRIFQNVKITEDDCKTHRGLEVKVTKYNYKNWIGRYAADSDHPYTASELKGLIGQTIKIRSPLYCETTNGYCKRCCGKLFEQVDIAAIGMQGLSITSGFVSVAMKSCHVSTLHSFTITDLKHFIR